MTTRKLATLAGLALALAGAIYLYLMGAALAPHVTSAPAPVAGRYVITSIHYPQATRAVVTLRWSTARVAEPRLRLASGGYWDLASTRHTGPGAETSVLILKAYSAN